jgi:hypothetical protein
VKMEMTDYGNGEYWYGIDYQGRGAGIMWFSNKQEAIQDAENTDQKHLPAELVRIPRATVEHSNIVYDYWPDTGDMEWRKRK